MGPTGSYSAYALGSSWLDFINIQFYNNFCGIQSYSTSNFNFDQWNTWAQGAKTQVLLGVPGADYSGNGYQPASAVVQMVKDLSSKYGPSNNGWFGGVMM